MFSDSQVLKQIADMDVVMVKVDMTDTDDIMTKDLARADRTNIPVNVVYPADYPNRPAILLEELISPSQALQALDRIE